MHSYTAQTEAMVQALVEYCRSRIAQEWPLDHARTPAELRAQAGETITSGGIGAAAALQLWDDVLSRACLSEDNPRTLSYIPSAPSKAAVAFDMLVGASSLYAGSWQEGSGAVYAENQALAWIASLVGFPSSAGGAFVQGGTVGNLSALVAAREREKRSGRRPARWAVALTTETHSSVKHTLQAVMDVDVIEVPGDERGRMTGDALRLATGDLAAEVCEGIFAVVATAGTTNLGVIDDLAGIADVAADHGWWVHVDGAYGGAGLAAPSVRHLYDGIERADSFIVDPHKWLFAPFDSCALVYRDPEMGRLAHTQKAAYLEPMRVETSEWNPSDYAVQLSRRARGLPFWYSLATHGTEAYRDAVETTLATARAGRQIIDRTPYLNLLVEPDLTVLVFERIGWSGADYAAWSSRLWDEQVAFVLPTTHRGRACTRLAIVNPRTTPADLQLIVDSMR